MLKTRGYEVVDELKSDEIKQCYILLENIQPSKKNLVMLDQWKLHFLKKDWPYSLMRKEDDSASLMFVTQRSI